MGEQFRVVFRADAERELRVVGTTSGCDGLERAREVARDAVAGAWTSAVSASIYRESCDGCAGLITRHHKAGRVWVAASWELEAGSYLSERVNRRLHEIA